MNLWADGAPVFVSGLRPFHPLFFLPALFLFVLGLATILFSGWRFDGRRARFYELTIVTTLAILGTAPRLLPFVLLAAALPALRYRSALASLALAMLLAAPWWVPGVEAMQHPRDAVRGSFRFAPLAATDHVPAKIRDMWRTGNPACPDLDREDCLSSTARGGRIESIDPFKVRVHSDGWNLLAAPHAWWPGWRVYLNGQRMPPVRVDGKFAGTFVPPGDATIEFRYRPRTFDFGLRATALGLILLVAWPWLERIRIDIPLERVAAAALVVYAAILIAHRCGIAGGADSSGYLNQARLWRSGTLSLPVPSDDHIPLGFAPGTRPKTMVPSYPPGLPLHMALLGDRGSSLLSPLAAIGCLLLLWRIARELEIERANAIAAAMILAFSPVFLFQSLQPMSDVVSTFWALVCIWCAMRGRERTAYAVAAGVAFGIGVLVRPTHILLFPAMLALLGLRVRTLGAFIAGGAPFALFQFAIANHWYGSPLKSGYGSITESIALRFFPTRFVHYSKWLAILFPLAFPLGLLKKRVALLLWFVPFFLFYCVYEPYETWWYTRFLLPAIPAVLLLAASFRIPRAALLTIVVAITATQLITAQRFHVLDVAKGEATYERAALLVKERVPQNAIVLASQHSGSLLFYANRLALRFDRIDASSSGSSEFLGVPRRRLLRGTPRTPRNFSRSTPSSPNTNSLRCSSACPAPGLRSNAPATQLCCVCHELLRRVANPLRISSYKDKYGGKQMTITRTAVGITLILLCAFTAAAQTPPIAKIDAPITIDGDLSDPAWQQATRFDTWYETNPGDNIAPKVKSTGWVAYDSRFLYFAIESEDPDPKSIISPFADHDQISGNTDDYVGIIVDTRNDGHSAYLFLLSARGVQYDAVTDDAGSGEDSSPDFFWDTAAKIHARGWSAEARIPFSSLRYDGSNPERWGLALYRNYPRDRRYQMFTSKLPRDTNCFVCNFEKVTGFHDLPAGDHMVLAPYMTAQQLGAPRENLGDPWVNRPVGAEGGLDFKWSPTADMAIDATINPDFSQVESDVAVISTNERFAISLPEKRPFFLEGIELFSTPIQAVYTRTITAPRWGTRTTGKYGPYAYTFLVAQDRGGGSVVLPSEFGSNFADQDFSSTAAIGRVRRDFGKRSFVSMLFTTRESDGGAHNRVFGPDFQWRIGDQNTITGQLLFSKTQTPNRTDLADEWTGQDLDGHAAHAYYAFSSDRNDFYISGSDYAKDFRADNGFVPQVGWRGSFSEIGHTFRPKGFFSRFRVYSFGEYQQTQEGDLLYRLASAGFGADGKFRSFTRLRLARDTVNNDGTLFDRDRVYATLQFAVNRVLSFVSLDGWVGDEVDFAKNRLGQGASLAANFTLRPTNHLQVGLTTNLRWLGIEHDRLFTSQVERVRATYTFNPRMFVRAIVQNQRTNRDQLLYDCDPQKLDDCDFAHRSGELAAQLLFAYKLNWQTVFYVGGGNLDEVVSSDGDFLPSSRQFFAKVSYAFQR